MNDRRHVVFAAPFLMETTLRLVGGVADLPSVSLSLITQESLDRIPKALRARLSAHRRVAQVLDPQELAGALRSLGGELGEVHRLLGALEHLQVPLAQVREALGIPGMGVEAATNFRDKNRMKDVLRENGLPCARHRLVTSPREAIDFVRRVGFPVVAKPPAGAGSLGTYRADSERALEEVLVLTRPSPEREVLFEEFITGQEQSFETISIDGKPVWHSLTHYLPTPLEAMENPWIQWCVLLPREIDHPRYDDIRQVASRAIEVLGMETGLTHLEWFRRGDGSLALSEVAARPPGAQITNLISHAHEIHFYRAWAKLMIYGVFDPPERRYAAGAAFLRGQGRGRVQRVHGLEQAQRELGELVVDVRLPKPGQPQASGYEGEGYVVIRHPETAVVEKALHRLISLIRVELG